MSEQCKDKCDLEMIEYGLYECKKCGREVEMRPTLTHRECTSNCQDQHNLLEQERDDLRRQVEEEKVICHQYKECSEMWFKKFNELEKQTAVLCGSLERVKEQEKKKCEHCGFGSRDCDECVVEAKIEFINKAITASVDNRYLRIEKVAKEVHNQYILSHQNHVQEDCECDTCQAIKQLATALEDGEPK